MNRLFIVVIIFLVPVLTMAQKARYTFRFVMEQSGSQLAIDSVFVENLSSQCDTMIYSPTASLRVNVLADLDSEYETDSRLRAESWHFDAADNSVCVSAFVPYDKVKVSMFDISGRLFCSSDFVVDYGYNEFKFFGSPRNAVVSLMCDGEETTLSIVNAGDTSSRCLIQCLGRTSALLSKSQLALGGFVFHRGDQLRFTMYSNSCGDVISREQLDNPMSSSEYTFDFTGIQNIRPDLISEYDSVCNMDLIQWTWQPVEGADGYKYCYSNDYESAVDLGTTTAVTFGQPIDSSSSYRMYVWAYNECGVSDANVLHASSPARHVTDAEYEIATAEGTTLRIMNIFLQPDSTILRTPSINVNMEDTIWNYLAQRMYQTARTTGVGIAAPQVGINRNVVCLQRWDKTSGTGPFASHPWEFYFNPQIVEYADSVVRRDDGCLSVPDGGDYPVIAGFSYRAIWVKVAYYDTEGVFHEEKITHQYTAHIFQHEIDHLNAVMFFDRQVEENAFKYTIIEGDSYDGLPDIR